MRDPNYWLNHPEAWPSGALCLCDLEPEGCYLATVSPALHDKHRGDRMASVSERGRLCWAKVGGRMVEAYVLDQKPAFDLTQAKVNRVKRDFGAESAQRFTFLGPYYTVVLASGGTASASGYQTVHGALIRLDSRRGPQLAPGAWERPRGVQRRRGPGRPPKKPKTAPVAPTRTPPPPPKAKKAAAPPPPPRPKKTKTPPPPPGK